MLALAIEDRALDMVLMMEPSRGLNQTRGGTLRLVRQGCERQRPHLGLDGLRFALLGHTARSASLWSVARWA